jgi:hypothetical protein
MVSKNARFLLFYSLCRTPRLFFIRPDTSQPRCELLFKRKHEMFAPAKTARFQIFLQASCFDDVAIVIAGGFPVMPPSRHRRPIGFAFVKRFLGEFRETYEDNILTLIRKLFTRRKSQ